MSNEYKRLREEMDSADLDSILPGFDREASWNELSQRLKKVQHKTYVWRYAAALVAIIIVAAMVRMQMDQQNTVKQIATTAPTVTTPAAVDTKVPLTPIKAEPTPAAKPAIIVRKSTMHKTAPSRQTVEPALQQQPQEEHIAHTQPETAQPKAKTTEQPAATVTPVIKRPKAVHLLDIDNENRQAAIQNRKELQGLTQRIVNALPGRPYSNTEDRKPSSLFRTN